MCFPNHFTRKLFLKVLGSRVHTFAEAVESGELPLSYRFGVKPRIMKGVPEFRYAVLLQDNSVNPPRRTYEDNLKAIPERLFNLTNQDHLVLLRLEGSAKLSAIKRFHWSVARAQGLTREQYGHHCRTVDLSLDGVKESAHAKRSLYIVTVRFGRSIYPYKVFNFLVGCNAKPSLHEVLRLVYVQGNCESGRF